MSDEVQNDQIFEMGTEYGSLLTRATDMLRGAKGYIYVKQYHDARKKIEGAVRLVDRVESLLKNEVEQCGAGGKVGLSSVNRSSRMTSIRAFRSRISILLKEIAVNSRSTRRVPR